MSIGDVAELVRRFEPVLFFHPDERLFPCDAKRYIERCAIWTVNGAKADDKHNWGGSGPGHFPRHPKFKAPLSALPGEMGTPVDSSLGGGVEESFLSFAGWNGTTGVGVSVSADSTVAYTNVDVLVDKYGAAVPEGLDQGLAESRFWYHAEVFDLPRLRRLIDAKADPRLIEALVLLGPDSVLLCYYFFFPGSDGQLEGCEGDQAKCFDNFAGQWSCVAILLEGTTPMGQPTQYEPKWLGMSSRAPGAVVTEETKAKHFGLIANDWSLVPSIKRDRGAGKPQGEHPLIFVARQTHGFYLTPGRQATLQLASDDIARSSCGEFESFEEEKAEADAVAAGYSAQRDKNSLFKWFCLFGGPIGFLIGLGYSGGMQGLANLGGPGPQEANTQFDHPPDAGQFGFVIHPEGITLPPSTSARTVPWPRFGPETSMTTSVNGKQYSLMLGTTSEPFSRPPWVPSDDHKTGFDGRWGERAEHDPQARRAGMQFLEYWELFLFALRKTESMP